MDVEGSSNVVKKQEHVRSEASKTCVLIVDSDRSSVESVDGLLENYQTVVAGGASEALLIIREKRCKVDVVLTEFDLPDMNGLDFVERVFEIRKLPILFLSDFQRLEVIKECLRKGAMYCFSKPFQKPNANTLWQFRVLNERNLSARSRNMRIWDYQNHGDDEDGCVIDDEVTEETKKR